MHIRWLKCRRAYEYRGRRNFLSEEKRIEPGLSLNSANKEELGLMKKAFSKY